MAIERWQPFGSIRDFAALCTRYTGKRASVIRNTKPDSWSILLDVVKDGDSLE